VPQTALTISEVGRLLGVPVPTLRSWELRYGVGVPERTAGGHRRYRPTDVAELQALSRAVAQGIAPRTAAQAVRRTPLDPVVPVALLGRLLDAAVARHPVVVARVLDEAEDELGLEHAVDRLLVPAMREIGRRWEVGDVDVGVEHLATGAVRAWLARRSGTVAATAELAPVLLAAAPGNQHTVALEAFAVLLERRGQPVCLLGADTPVAAVVTSWTATGASAAVVTAQQVSRRRAAVQVLEALRERGATPLLYAGAAFDDPRGRRAVPGSYLGTDLPVACDLVLSAVGRSGGQSGGGL
jgi:MerR family transcriptional regulator, light-induced transcriptional regulator